MPSARQRFRSVPCKHISFLCVTACCYCEAEKRRKKARRFFKLCSLCRAFETGCLCFTRLARCVCLSVSLSAPRDLCNDQRRDDAVNKCARAHGSARTVRIYIFGPDIFKMVQSPHPVATVSSCRIAGLFHCLFLACRRWLVFVCVHCTYRKHLRVRAIECV